MRKISFYLMLSCLASMIAFSCKDDEKKPPFLLIDQTELVIPDANDTLLFSIQTDELWNISNSNSDWITVEPMSGVGNATISIYANKNTLADTLHSTITVTAGELTQEILIKQVGNYESLFGDYDASGEPSYWTEEEAGPSSWVSKIAQPADNSTDYYVLTDFGGPKDADGFNGINVLIDVDPDGRLTIDSETIVGEMEDSTVVGYFTATYLDDEGFINIIEEDYEVQWDETTGTLDMSGTYNGKEVIMFVTAFMPLLGEPVGGLTDGYANCKFVRKEGGNLSFEGKKVLSKQNLSIANAKMKDKNVFRVKFNTKK